MISTFLVNPSEGEITRRTAYIRNNGFILNKPSFTVLSNRCAHLGCPTQPNGPMFDNRKIEQKTPAGDVTLIPTLPAGGFGCPCHGGQYDQEGNRTAGPPVRALDRYEFYIRNGRLALGKTYSVAEVIGAGASAGRCAGTRRTPPRTAPRLIQAPFISGPPPLTLPARNRWLEPWHEMRAFPIGNPGAGIAADGLRRRVWDQEQRHRRHHPVVAGKPGRSLCHRLAAVCAL